MRYRVKVEWENEDGGSETAELGQVEAGLCLTESDVGLKLAATQEIMVRLQSVVTTHNYNGIAKLLDAALRAKHPET